MNYCKINTQNQPQMMPNPFRVTVANPTEEQKSQLADMFGWLEMVYTDAPEYDPETQYITHKWEEKNGKAVQVWTLYDIPVPEPTIEDRLDDLEEGMDMLLGGELNVLY